MTGRPSIPELSVHTRRGRGVLDAPHARSMTAERDVAPRSRGTKASELCSQTTLENRGRRECRVLAAPMARLQQKKQAAVTTGLAKATGIPCANGFNGFLRALPGDRALLPPSSADHPANLAPASGRQNHTTSPSALRLRSSCATHASTASRSQRP